MAKPKQIKTLIKDHEGLTSQIKRPVNHHDLFFKAFYSEPALALELFQLIFSKEELKACDWKNLKAEKDSLKEKRADLIFSVPLKAHPKTTIKIFILLEHKSYYDPELFNQMLYYQTLLHEHILKAKGTASPIITVVVYNGKTPWKWAKTFQETVYKGFLEKIPAQFRKNMIDYEVRLFDAHNPKLKGVFKNKNFKSRGALYLLQQIWNIKLTRAELKEALALFSDFSAGRGRQRNLMKGVYDYLKAVLKEGEKLKKLWKAAEQELVEKGIFKKGGYMDIIEYMKAQDQMKGLKKGRKEGRQEVRQEMMRKMLKKKADISFISEVTGFSVKEIKKLKNSSSK